MGEQGGLRTGWLAAFGTEGYDGEPPLLEELGVNFGHIKVKVCLKLPLSLPLRPAGHFLSGCGVIKKGKPHPPAFSPSKRQFLRAVMASKTIDGWS